jgi:hypothetical protein
VLHVLVSNKRLLSLRCPCTAQIVPAVLLIKLPCAALHMTDMPCSAVLLSKLLCTGLLLLPTCATLPLTTLAVHLAGPIILLYDEHVSLTALHSCGETRQLVNLIKALPCVCLLLLRLGLQAA